MCGVHFRSVRGVIQIVIMRKNIYLCSFVLMIAIYVMVLCMPAPAFAQAYTSCCCSKVDASSCVDEVTAPVLARDSCGSHCCVNPSGNPCAIDRKRDDRACITWQGASIDYKDCFATSDVFWSVFRPPEF